MEKITVEVKDWEAKIVRSPVYWFVAATTGIFSTFAPFALFLAGADGVPMITPFVLALFALIYLVSGFYLIFGIKVINKLWETK